MQISGSLPASVWVRKAPVHETDIEKAYCVMNGLGTPGQKVYRSANRGFIWVNVTGNLPDIPLADLVPHPTDPNTMYLGSEFGCFRTTDNGVHWVRWNNGLPEAAIVTEMGYLDLRSQNGEFWIVAGTYGRGIWKRNVAGDRSAFLGGESAAAGLGAAAELSESVQRIDHDRVLAPGRRAREPARVRRRGTTGREAGRREAGSRRPSRRLRRIEARGRHVLPPVHDQQGNADEENGCFEMKTGT